MFAPESFHQCRGERLHKEFAMSDRVELKRLAPAKDIALWGVAFKDKDDILEYQR